MKPPFQYSNLLRSTFATLALAGLCGILLNGHAFPQSNNPAPPQRGLQLLETPPEAPSLEEIRNTLKNDRLSESERIDKALEMLSQRIETQHKQPPQRPSNSLSRPGFGGGMFGNDPFFNGTWDPMREMQEMQRTIDETFNNAFSRYHSNLPSQPNNFQFNSSFTPNTDITERDDAYIVGLDLPGVDKSNINIEVQGQNLIVSGERDELIEEKNETGRVIRSERRSGSFHRAIPLPGPVDATKIEANFDNGELKIVVPKNDQKTQTHTVIIK